MRQLVRFLLLWSMVIAVMNGCGTSKVVTEERIDVAYSKKEIIQYLETRSIDYTWLNGKAKAVIESPQENASGLMYLRNPKDSLIWLLIKKRSVEASRILMRPDSLFVIYRLDQKYERQSIAEVSNTLNLELSFEEIQDMVSGNIPVPDTASIQIDKINSDYEVKGKYKDISVTYLLGSYNLQLHSAQFSDKNGRTIVSKYDDYKLYNGKGEIPYFRSYEFTTPEGERTYVELEIMEIEFDKPSRILFSIPGHYEEVY